MKTNSSTAFSDQLDYLKLPFIKDHHSELAGEAARQTWDHQEYLRRLVDGEFGHRQQRSIEWRIKAARFPVIKTLEELPLGLAQKNQPAPDPGPLPAGVHARKEPT